MARILERLGHTVVCPEGPACCGQPAFNTGYWDESREVAIKVLESLQGAEVVVIASGSCGAMMKVFYPELFAGTKHEAMARELAPKCYEFSAFLVNKLGVTDLGARFPAQSHFPRRLPRFAGAEQQAPAARVAGEGAGAGIGGDGRGGNLLRFRRHVLGQVPDDLHRDGRGQMRQRRSRPDAEYIVSYDSSCLMQIQGLLDRQRKPIKTIHLAEVLVQQ